MQKSLLVFLLCALLSFKIRASTTPEIHILPKPTWISSCKSYHQKPAVRDINDGAYYELVEEQINVESKASYYHYITQIVSESGVQDNSSISVSFDPSYERIDFHELIVWRNNKPQNRLNVDGFKILAEENEFDKFIYNGTYSAKYILPDIRKGDKIEYAYTITGRNPIFGNKFCRTIYLQGSSLIAHQYTALLFSASRKLNIKDFNLRSKPQITNSKGLVHYAWEDMQVPGAPYNKRQPKWLNPYSRVQVSDYNNWGEVVNWGLKINPLQTNFTGELADTISKLKIKYANNKEKFFRAAVTLVQDEIRYMGVETGQYSNKANRPDKVYQQRYGDCKDKSLLLASILNAGGIEAHLVLVNTDLKDKILDLLPSTALFNHAVVVATLNGKQTWVDATISYQRGNGANIYFPDYQYGLILKTDNNGLTKINPTQAGKIIYDERYTITDEHAPVYLKVITTYSLNEADDVRSNLASDGIAKTEKNYLNYYAKTYSKIEASDSIIVKDNEEKNVLTTIENYTIHNFFKRDSINGKYILDFYADYISEQLPDVSGQINTPVRVNYPCDIDYKVSFNMPGGWDIADEHYELKRNAYRLIYDKDVVNDKLSLHYQFAYLRDYIPAEKLSEFKQDIKNLKNDQLWYSFFYQPDIKKAPFKANPVMLAITLIIVSLSIFFGLRIYKTETRNSLYFNRDNTFSPALGGWLIILLISLTATPIYRAYYLIDLSFFGMSKWDLLTVGMDSVKNRILLVFQMTGNIAIICFSIFCVILTLKKRDIAPRLIKGLFVLIVLFFSFDYIFAGYIKGHLYDYDMMEVIKAVAVAAIWTYYLNTSERVKETFVVPYPD